jgi:predicted RNase H-like nuclease (RuvC/YqgF family)
MARRLDQRLSYFALGCRRARKQMIVELKATVRSFNDEIEALRRELRELKAAVARKREIERAIEAERQGLWLQ